MTSATPIAVRAEPLILVEEITHRVLNEYAEAISGISLACAGVADARTRDALNGTARRLRDQAQVHRALQAPSIAGMIDLDEYLSQICAALSSARLQDRGVRLTLVQGELQLEAARCWRVGLIVAELITNAERHGLRGGGGEIAVEVGSQGELALCRVSDNGAAAHVAAAGRGRRLVQGLAAELGGHVEWWFSTHGTTVLLSFPRVAAPGQSIS